ncbi:MAG: PHP domain-containing protein [Candidatus Kaelpia imicola]|nr:PHP domain-containing protein [Candidatus Kaelpia imicola]
MINREDWHIHSIYSGDSKTSPIKIVDTSIKRGLKKICVLDHNTIRGGLEAREHARGKDIEILVGAEIKTDKGEIAGVGLEREIESRELFSVIKEIKSQGAKILIPHPYGGIRYTKRDYSLEEVGPFADYIEVFNGRSFFNFYQKRILGFAKRFDIIPIRGSDAHFAFEIGNLSIRSIYKGIVGFFTTGFFNVIFANRKRLKRK